MAWDDKGWHEGVPQKDDGGPVEERLCMVCRYFMWRHMTKIEYVSARLDGRKTNALGQ